jgi:hypothetical protein
MDVKFQRDDPTPAGKNLRFFRWRNGIRYEGTHNSLWVGGALLNEKPRDIAGGFWIKHYTEDRGIRNANRLMRKARYYDWLGENEADFRRRHVLI